MSKDPEKDYRHFYTLLFWGIIGSVFGFVGGFIFVQYDQPAWVMILFVFVFLCLSYFFLQVYFTLFPEKKVRFLQKARQRSLSGIPADLSGRAKSMLGWIFIGFSVPFLVVLPIIITLQAFTFKGSEALLKSVNKIFGAIGVGDTSNVYIAVGFLMVWMIGGFILLISEFLFLKRWLLLPPRTDRMPEV